MKHLFILLLMLAAFPGQAADNTPADGGNTSQAEDSVSKSENGNTSQAEDSVSKSDGGKKPEQEDEEEEPDCE